MSRARRKHFERIYTQRAQAGFPRVSKAILHKDGSITEAQRIVTRAVISLGPRKLAKIAVEAAKDYESGIRDPQVTVDRLWKRWQPSGLLRRVIQALKRILHFW